jgi:excinuclease ABC subunit C
MVFQGRSDELQHLLQEQMQKYADRTDYESAARVRDQLQGLDQLTADQKMSLPDSSVSRDVLALACDERLAAVQLFQMRAGKLVGRLGYTADAAGLSPGLILQRVIEEHYSQVDAVEVPPQLLVQHPLPQQPLLEEWLTEQRERKVQIHCPQRRQKADLIELVQRNAEFELLRAKQGQEQQALSTEDLAQLLDLPLPPRRIEGYDISHIQGSDAVASQVVFIDGLPRNSITANTKFRAAASVQGIAMTSWQWQKLCEGGFAAGHGQKLMGSIWELCVKREGAPFKRMV